MTTLLDIWIGQKDFFDTKSIEQILNITGDGALKDGNETSTQLREFLANIPAQNISRYVNDCLSSSFPNSGLVLQDIVNEVGRRIGFAAEHGYYRGGPSKIGFDGIWTAKDGYSIVVEVKTTDAYQINLDTLAQYRQKLIAENRIEKTQSSILIVVGRKDTGGLEAQTRGSRHAWDIRIISAEALLKLMLIKENLNDLNTVSQIQEVLKPLEYTRVDRLIDIMFRTSEDLQADDAEVESEQYEAEEVVSDRVKTKPVTYHQECVNKISEYLKVPLIKQGKSTYTNADQTLRILCIVSKEYERGDVGRYWYAFHPSQQEFLNEGETSYIAFGCGSADQIIFIPSEVFQKHIHIMRTTETDKKFYWHVEIFKDKDKYLLYKKTNEGIDISQYLLKLKE